VRCLNEAFKKAAAEALPFRSGLLWCRYQIVGRKITCEKPATIRPLMPEIIAPARRLKKSTPGDCSIALWRHAARAPVAARNWSPA